MATNKLLPFANGVGANVTDYDTWSALATLLSQGFTTGVARSDYANRVFAQGALASYILGQFVVDQTAQDADLNESVFYTNFKNALTAYIKTNAVSLDTVQTVGGVKTFTSSPIVPTPTSGDDSTKVATTAYVQTEIASKANASEVVKLTGAQTVAGVKTFSSSPVVPTLNRFDTSTKTVNSAWAYGLARQGNYLDLIDLGTPDDDFWNSIDDGNFSCAPVGGYFYINGHRYYLAHADYWMNSGQYDNTKVKKHHMVVYMQESGVSGKMNATNTNAGAYVGCDFRTGNNGNTALATLRSVIQTDWGADHILTHELHLQNAVTDGYPSGGGWYSSDIDLMSEIMAYGCKVFSPMSSGAITYMQNTEALTQLELFARHPELLRPDQWLRDIAAGSGFARISGGGTASHYAASNRQLFKPVFAIVKSNS